MSLADRIVATAESIHPTREWPPTNPRTGAVILIPDEHHTEGHDRRGLFKPQPPVWWPGITDLDAELEEYQRDLNAYHEREIARVKRCPECAENKRRKAAYYQLPDKEQA